MYMYVHVCTCRSVASCTRANTRPVDRGWSTNASPHCQRHHTRTVAWETCKLGEDLPRQLQSRQPRRQRHWFCDTSEAVPGQHRPGDESHQQSAAKHENKTRPYSTDRLWGPNINEIWCVGLSANRSVYNEKKIINYPSSPTYVNTTPIPSPTLSCITLKLMRFISWILMMMPMTPLMMFC